MKRFSFSAIFFLLFLIGFSCSKTKTTTFSRSFYKIKKIPWGYVSYFKQSRRVKAVAVTKNHVWIGTDGGLQHFNQNGEDYHLITSQDGLPSNQINALSWHNNILWVGTSKGLAQYSEGAWQNQKVGIEGEITALEGEKSSIWVGTDKGLAAITLGRSLIYKKSISVKFIEAKDNGGVWVGTKDHGLLVCGNGTCKPYKSKIKTVFSMQKRGDSIWISGQDKNNNNLLLLHNGDNKYYYKFSHPVNWLQAYKNEVMIYSGKTVSNLVSCNQAGKKGKKLKFFGSKAPCFRRISVSTDFPPGMTIVHRKNNYLWVGTDTMGLLRFDGRIIRYFSSNNLINKNADSFTVGCENKTEICYFAAGNNSFTFNDKRGFELMEQKHIGWHFIYFLNDFNNKITAIGKNSRGDLLFFRKTGNSWKKMMKEYPLTTEMPEVYINFSYFTKDYISWIGLGNKNTAVGVFVFNFKNKNIYPPINYKTKDGKKLDIPASSRKMSMRFGHRYLASEKGVVHLWRVDGKKQIEIIDDTNGLNSNVVNDVIFDKNGKLWVGTDLGLCEKDDNYWKCNDKSILPGTGEIQAMAYDEVNDIVYAANRSFIYKIKNGKVDKLDALGNLLEKRIESIKLDKKNRLWVLHSGGISIIYLNK
ncbi:MAG: two-component regulator propeller domain-containing protein [Myxococcota bacterium]